jgi:polyphosphate glucokinase
MSKNAKQGLPLGIDVGGSGIKGAPVDLSKGAFASKRMRIDTPLVSTPEAVADVINQVVEHFEDVRGDSPIGVTIPGVVTHGVVRSAANIDKSWLDFDAEPMLEAKLGHLEIDGYDAETRAASSVKDKEGLSYPEWAKRLQRYYSHVEALLWPELFVVGGGVSKDADQFLPLLKLKTPIVAATLQNKAGIIGAAHLAQEEHDRRHH